MALNDATTLHENAESKEAKHQVENKSSMEILSELFSTFDAEPPVIVKKENGDDNPKKHKKGKKKHKHKDKKEKKRKKKSKKKRRKSATSCSSDSEGIDLSELIKTEITETSLLSETLQKLIKNEIKQEVKEELKEKNTPEGLSISAHSSTKDPEITLKTQSEKVCSKSKIIIKDIKASSLHKNDKHKHERLKRKKHEHVKHVETSSKRIRLSRSPSIDKTEDSRSRSREKSRKTKREDDKYHRSKDRSPRTKHSDFYDKYDTYKDCERYKSDYNHQSHRSHKSRDDCSKQREDYKYRDDYRHRKEARRDDFYKKYDDQMTKDSFKPREHDRSQETRTSEREMRFDKKKLLEIARKNAIQMMKSGELTGALTLGPQAQEKVIAAISGGGKTIEELTDFCKTLSKKEELGELSSVSSTDDSESEEEDLTIRHPFQIKEKSFTINIKNSVSLPIRTNQERQSELRIQFPVSSGQLHRKTEGEWVPVEPKKSEPSVKTPAAVSAASVTPLAIEAAPPRVPPPAPPMQMAVVPLLPGPQVIPPAKAQTEQEIALIVSQRLSAMRKLQENPNDSQAIKEMYNAQQGMNSWAESKLPLGHFTGTTGANILSQAQLASGYQAWARKDQLQTAAPVSGGMGMHLLQKMGWRPGEGLGKEKTGTLEPLLLEVKLDKKGVIAKEECKKAAPAVRIPKQTVKTLEGKHPVSLLHEYASKRKLGAPEYVLDFECGPDHMKNFLFKVVLNGTVYKPNVASGNKKDAKALAATICLQGLGLLPA